MSSSGIKMMREIIATDNQARIHQYFDQAEIPPYVLTMPWAIWMMPRGGLLLFQRVQLICRPSVLINWN
jgi:hypothetical protein